MKLTRTLLLCGCALAAGSVAFAETPVPNPEVPPSQPVTIPSDLLQKIQALDAVHDNSFVAESQRKTAGDGNQPVRDPQGPTVITARDTDFQKDKHLAIFLNRVIVDTASFHLVCNKLTAFLAHGKPAAAKSTPVEHAPKAGGKEKGGMAQMPGNDALEKAIAEGYVEITQDKIDAAGNVVHTVGHGDKAVYDKLTGDIILSGMPDWQQGDNLCYATSDTTTMVVNRDGRMKAYGPHTTVIQESQK